MGKFMDYDNYASKYAYTRQSVNWILSPLLSEVRQFTDGSAILEIGCGTGNYIIDISKQLQFHDYKAFDISNGMLDVAKSRSVTVNFRQGNADSYFPYEDETIDMAFAVDVIQHITSPRNFFQEAYRVLKKKLILVTDSRENIRKRSLIKYFPEALEIELNRYPEIDELNYIADFCGLELVNEELAEGTFEIDNQLISRFEEKCSSATRLMNDEDHKRGIERLKAAQLRGEKWFSSYTILQYLKAD